VFAYDRARTARQRFGRNTSSFPLISSEPVSQSTRIFVDCDLSTWPSAKHFFESPEGPHYEQATGHLYWLAFLGTQIIWPLSFIITEANAKQWGVPRLQAFYIYLGKITAITLELFWWRAIGRKMDRLTWSADFGETNYLALRYYDILNKYPSVLCGAKRASLLAVLTATFLSLGFTTLRFRWAQWAGIMLGLELIPRVSVYFTWLYLPKSRVGQLIIRETHKYWPGIRQRLLRVRERGVVLNLDRTPYQE